MPRTRSMVRRVAAVSGSPLAGKKILDSNNINKTLFIKFNISWEISNRISYNFLDWAAINDKFRAMNNSMVYGERIGCTIESSWKLVDCVRKGRSFGELANIEFKPEIGTWPWSPVVQVTFI